MSRDQLLDQLERHYQSQGWPVRRPEDATLAATGPGGVTWLGLAVVGEDLSGDELERRLRDLSERRMPSGGELCPLDLLAEQDCQAGVEALLERVGLADRPHVSLYSLTD